MAAEGLGPPRWWSNAPGDRYGRHDHPYHKVLYCAAGSIVFHLPEGGVTLRAGDRLEVAPGTEHSAIVGKDGVTCVEASRPA
ncbi:MAG: cupin domain-containing protein [Actinomycetota bacterium]